MNEVEKKIAFIRDILRRENISAVRFRGVDWFSWITAGGSSVVIMTAETGIADVLVTLTDAWIVTTKIEAERLATEEVPEIFKITSLPWQDEMAIEKFIQEKTGRGTVASDRPGNNERPLPQELLLRKMILQSEEIKRYRDVGKKAAQAMTVAMARAKPDWTENQLAGAGAEALWSRGLEPTLILVAGEKRGKKFRHPISKNEKIGNSAMMVFCARGFGLYANLTRFISFGTFQTEQKIRFEQLEKIESAAFLNTRPGHTLSNVYNAMEKTYVELGLKEEINLHHQGGPTGYLSREFIARDLVSSQNSLSSTLKIETGMAFAWNPSLPGAKIEDTILVSENGIEVLTVDTEWPTKTINGIKRPEVWIRT